MGHRLASTRILKNKSKLTLKQRVPAAISNLRSTFYMYSLYESLKTTTLKVKGQKYNITLFIWVSVKYDELFTSSVQFFMSANTDYE